MRITPYIDLNNPDNLKAIKGNVLRADQPFNGNPQYKISHFFDLVYGETNDAIEATPPGIYPRMKIKLMIDGVRGSFTFYFNRKKTFEEEAIRLVEEVNENVQKVLTKNLKFRIRELEKINKEMKNIE